MRFLPPETFPQGPPVANLDRLFWTSLRRGWPHRAEVLVIVNPETVIGWPREGFRLYWAGASPPRPGMWQRGRFASWVHQCQRRPDSVHQLERLGDPRTNRSRFIHGSASR